MRDCVCSTVMPSRVQDWLLVVGVVQVVAVVVQGPQVGPGQVEYLVCRMVPVCPVGQLMVCV